MNRVAPVRAAAETSVLVRASRKLLAAARTGASPARASAPWDTEFEVLADTLSRSRIGRLIASVVDLIREAWRHARTAGLAGDAATTIAALGPVDRARAAGIAMVAATLIDLLLTPLDLRPVSAARWALWAGAFIVGVSLSAWPHHAVAAWIDRQSRRRGVDPDIRG